MGVVVVDDGTMTNLNPNVSINEIIEGIKFQLQQVAQNHHITFDFGLSGSKSGVALRMENLELLESREDEVEKWTFAEKEMYDIEKVVSEIESNINLPEDFSINYDEVEFPDADQEMAEWDWKFKNGLADKIDYLMAHDPDGFPTREDAEKYLAERKMSMGNIKMQSNNKENAFKLERNA